jgi:hypothetical protein
MGKSNLNVFFNNYASFGEQTLIEDLIIESIGIYGLECWYIPRTLVNYNEVYGEDAVSQYLSSYYIPMYIKNINGFGGDGDFLSKFNIQIRDTVTFTVARRSWLADIGTPAALARPQEGDLIWFPLNQKTFVIKFVEHESIFYQMGALQTWDLDCELWEYSNELLATGIPEIDNLQKNYAFDLTSFPILTENGFRLSAENGFNIIQEEYNFETQVGDHLGDNLEIQDEADEFLDFTVINPIGRNV